MSKGSKDGQVREGIESVGGPKDCRLKTEGGRWGTGRQGGRGKGQKREVQEEEATQDRPRRQQTTNEPRPARICLVCRFSSFSSPVFCSMYDLTEIISLRRSLWYLIHMSVFFFFVPFFPFELHHPAPDDIRLMQGSLARAYHCTSRTLNWFRRTNNPC